MDCGPLDMLVQIVQAGRTDAVLPEQPWPERTHLVTSENGWATTTTLLQLAATVDDVMKLGKEGQAWIFLWDMASIHASVSTLAAMRATFPHVVLCFLTPRSTSYLQPCRGLLRREQGLEHGMLSMARTERRRIPRGR